MTPFRTELLIPPSPFQLGLASSVLTMGSCFAQVIGDRLVANKIRTLSNPFGTLFNPISIHKLLLQASQQSPAADNWILHQGRWYHFDYHSQFSGAQKADVEQQIRHTITETHAFIQQTDVFILTYGTAWVYARKDPSVPRLAKATTPTPHTEIESGIVANCHKVPASHFDRFLASTEQIISSFAKLYAALKTLRPSAQIILTVSPVRHTRDTIPLNQVSKSLLRVSCHELTQRFADVHYFASYELMMDDLRDYRFYQADMIHPNEVAEEYIWQKFTSAYLTPEAQTFLEEWKAIQQALQHRPFQPDSVAHQQFLQHVLTKLDKIASQVDVEPEREKVRQRLHAFPS